MMLLQMTDGTTSVQGMEYRQIQALSGALQPGFKVSLYLSPPCCWVVEVMGELSSI
jgi:hypothetical protein